MGLDVLPVLAVKVGCEGARAAEPCAAPGHRDGTCQLPQASDAPTCM